ncbi:MAG: tRNA lysidine(34) synthetase TilS [Acidimicrobiales bacterium]|nr:tRNA lysidine(34) synthetase TilS [Acidimicrobiales bacterium]
MVQKLELENILNKCNFPPPNSEIDLAVSGGPDSTAMLILANLAQLNISVHHVDHGLRNNGETETHFVSDLADRFAGKFYSYKLSIEDGPNLEARLREARFKVLPSGVATGHTMDDQAETVLLQLMRGAGISGLGGMREGYSHPILGIRRGEAVDVVNSMEIEPLLDPSNSEGRFKRNRVRHELVPLMNNVSDRDVVPLLARVAKLCAGENAFLDSLTVGLDSTDTKVLKSADEVLSKRALRNFLKDSQGYPPSYEELNKAWRVVKGEVKATELCGGRRLSRRQGKLSLMESNAHT